MRGGQTPVWDEEARFELTEGTQNRLLKLSVLDETDTKPELIGDTVIQLKPAFDSNPIDGYDAWHELTYKGKYAGEVYLEMTFYPAKPSARRKKRDSTASRSSVASYAQSTMSTSTCRPLPEQPGGARTPELSASASMAASQASETPSAPPTPPTHSVFGRSDSLLSMSTLSRVLPNPFSYNLFGSLQTIPPEQQADNDDEDPMSFFTTPLPEDDESSASVSRQTSTHRYTPARSSPLSQSTSRETLELSEPSTPASLTGYETEFSSSASEYGEYYTDNSAAATAAPLPPAHQGSLFDSKRVSVRRKPISRKAPLDPGATDTPFSADCYQQPAPPPSQRAHHSHSQHHSHRVSKPLPREPLVRAPSAAGSFAENADYLGEGQWDLSDELNAGYSDDVYGGFMRQSLVLPPMRRSRSRQERHSLPSDLARGEDGAGYKGGVYQPSGYGPQHGHRVYSGATIRGADDMGDYYYSEGEDDHHDAIRYVR